MESSTFTTDVMSALSSSDARSSESVEQYLLEPSASSLVHAEAADQQICPPVENVSNAGAVQSVDHLQPVQRSSPCGENLHVGESVAPSTTMGPLTFEEWKLAMKLQIQRDFQQLQICKEQNEKYKDMCTPERIIVDVDKVLHLCKGFCEVDGCGKERGVVGQKLEGGVLVVSLCCEKGHKSVWHSSEVLAEKRGQNLYVNPTLMAAAVLVTGNNFDKVSLFAKCLNLNFVSQSSFTRIQTNYIIPSIKDLWGRMKERIWNLFQRENLVMCGDGRMDSPGFSAKYCFYVMMDHYLDVIVDCEVVDKRETGGTSTLMEKMGCKRILERMIGILNTSELVTDASSVIMKMVRELKGTSLNLKNLGLMHK